MVLFTNSSPCKRSELHQLTSQSSTPLLLFITTFPVVTKGPITMLALS
jgi:hypothetical protein